MSARISCRDDLFTHIIHDLKRCIEENGVA